MHRGKSMGCDKFTGWTYSLIKKNSSYKYNNQNNKISKLGSKNPINYSFF